MSTASSSFKFRLHMVFGSALVPALIRRGLLTSERCLHPFAAADLVHEVTSPIDQT